MKLLLSSLDDAKMLFQAIKDELNMPYGCMARVEYITEDTTDFLANTGCRYLAMGIECGNEEFRNKHLSRHMPTEKIAKAFAIAKKRNIYTCSFNMIGYPCSYDDDLTRETILLNQEIHPDYVQFSIFYPFPGTKLYQHCIENNLIDHDKIRNLSNYYSDSPLKDVSLQEKINEIHWRFNPNGFTFSLDGKSSPQSLSLKARLERASYISSKPTALICKYILFSLRTGKSWLKKIAGKDI